MLQRPLAFATGVIGFATLLAYGGRWSWFCELLVNFRTHFALFLGLALAAAVVLRQPLLGAAAALALLLNLWPLHGALFGSAWPPAAEARAVRVVAFNIQVRNDDLPGIATYLDSLAPDVVVLEEMTRASADRLRSLLPGLAHHQAVTEAGRGVMLLSRWPLLAPQVLRHDGVMFAVRADVDLGDRRLRLYGAHLNWPVVPVAAEGRNAQLLMLGHELAACEGACVVVGDFNLTPWSSWFRDLQARSRFRSCNEGQGLLPTWPAGLPAFLRIRIDHCLVSPAVSVANVRVGEAVGSDHLATINDLLVGAPQTKTPP